jgi:hypothetical protein
MGQMFDAVSLPRRYLRPLADMWIRWSYKWLIQFGDLRCDKIRLRQRR